MVKIILPKPLLEWINSTRDYASLPSFIVKCVAYAKIKNLTVEDMNKEIKQHLKEQGVYDEKYKGFRPRK